MGSKGDTLRKK